jgi:xanthine dehydrogenase accessory factor
MGATRFGTIEFATVYDIAFSVAGCLRAGTRVDVAWVVEASGFGASARAQSLALTPGGGRVGTLLAGALDMQLADLASFGGGGRLVDLQVGDLDALAAGLAHGGDARCLLMPADELPPELWDRLREREPVCLVTRLDDGRVRATELFTADTMAGAGGDAARLFDRRVSDSAVTATTVTTVLWPVPTLVIVGGGPVAAALDPAARLLGWQVQTMPDPVAAAGLIATLAPLDKVVVASHDVEVAGAALEAALDSDVGYIGSVGSRAAQQARADWLAYRDVTDLTRVHGPAGLSIGASSPAEIAVSILAEALAVRAAATAGP